MYVAASCSTKEMGFVDFFPTCFRDVPPPPSLQPGNQEGGYRQLQGHGHFTDPPSLGFPLCSHCCCSLKHLTSLLLSLTTPIQHTWPQQPEWLCYCSAYNPSRLFCVWHKSHNPHPGPQGSPWGDFSLLSTLSLWSPSSLGAQCSRGALLSVPQFSPSRTFGKPSPCQPWVHTHPQTQHSTPSPQSLSGLLLLPSWFPQWDSLIAICCIDFCFILLDCELLENEWVPGQACFVFQMAGMLSGMG